MISVLVLGGESGIGREVSKTLASSEDTQVWVTYSRQDIKAPERCRSLLFKPAASRQDCTDVLQTLLETSQPNAIVNCLYATPAESSTDVEKALTLNSLLPHIVASEANRVGAITIQPSSYAVFQPSGTLQTESSATDAVTVFGRSTAIGEVSTKGVYHLRADVIGPRITEGLFSTIFETDSVLEVSKDIYSQPITTLAFARIVRGLIRDEVKRERIGNLHHIMSDGAISEFEQAVSIIAHFRQERLSISDPQHSESTQSTVLVGTDAPDEHKLLWEMAGYPEVPTFDELAEELYAYCKEDLEDVC